MTSTEVRSCFFPTSTSLPDENVSGLALAPCFHVHGAIPLHRLAVRLRETQPENSQDKPHPHLGPRSYHGHRSG